MAVDDAQRRDFLRNHVTSDLQYVWEDSQVSLDMQYRMAQHYTSLRVFIALAETAAELRTALRTDFQLDPTAGAEQRAELARVVSSWLTGRQLYEKETELTAESKVMGMLRNLQHSERLAMVKAVEDSVRGPCRERHTICRVSCTQGLKECENGEITASTLDEVTSKAHKNTSSLQTFLGSSRACQGSEEQNERGFTGQHRGVQTSHETGIHHVDVHVGQVQIQRVGCLT